MAQKYIASENCNRNKPISSSGKVTGQKWKRHYWLWDTRRPDVTHLAPAARLPGGTVLQVACARRLRFLSLVTVLVILRAAHYFPPYCSNTTGCWTLGKEERFSLKLDLGFYVYLYGKLTLNVRWCNYIVKQKEPKKTNTLILYQGFAYLNKCKLCNNFNGYTSFPVAKTPLEISFH